MKKKLSLLMVMLVAMITSAWADTVVLSSPTESVKTHSDANGIITITDASDKTGIQAGSGTLSYGDASATPMKLSGSRQFNLSYSSAVTITKVTLYATDNKADGNTYTIGTSSSDKTSLGNLPAKGSTPAAIDITGKTGLYATAQFLAVIVVEYSSTAPSLTASPTALTLSLNPSNPSAKKTFTLTGKNLINGTYNLSIPSVTGLTVEPTSFTVASGAVNQEFTVTYASTEDVAKATAEIATPTINDLSATVAVTYQSRATANTWATVSDAATWDWSKLTETVELTDDTTPNKTDEFLLADLDDRINFVDAFGDPKAIKMEATQFPSRGGYAQGTYIKFKTATAGTIDVDFSNTGGNRPDRYLQVNGQSTMFKSNTADKVSATAVPVPAGEVTLSGWLDDGDNSGANMLRWYKITYTPSEPEPVVMPDDAEDWSITEGNCTVVQTEMSLVGQTAKVAFEESGDVYMQVSVAGATVTLKGRFNSSSNLVTFPKGQTATVGSTTVYLMGAASLAGEPTDIEFNLDETKTTLTQMKPYIVASGNKDAIVAVAYIQNLKLQKPADDGSIKTIAALNALENEATFTYSGKAVVVAMPKKGAQTYCYIKDDTGSSLIFDQKTELTTALAVGKQIAAPWTGKVSIYNQLFEVVPDAALTATEDAAVAPVFEEATLGDVNAASNVNKVVKLTDVTIIGVSGSNFKLTKGDAIAVGYNQFAIEGLANGLVCSEIIGAVGNYNGTIQFQPISFVVGTPAPEPQDVEISPATGTDIYAELAAATAAITPKNITINLAEGGAYTISGSIGAPASVTINGNGATIDASALTTPFIQMSKTPSVEGVAVGDVTAYPIDGVIIKDVKITGLQKQLFYANKTQYLLQKLSLLNSVVGLAGTKTIFDFSSGGNVVELLVDKSTIYGPKEGWSNGGFHSTQTSKSVQQLGGEYEKTTITNSTLYNIAYGRTTSTIVKNSQTWMSYEVRNNVIVNCGKSGQFCAGLNSGQSGKADGWTVDNNVFNFDDVDVSVTENSKIAGEITNSIAGVMTFTSTETPDFGGTFALAAGAKAPETAIGDPRWTITFEAPKFYVVAAGEVGTDQSQLSFLGQPWTPSETNLMEAGEDGKYTKVYNNVQLKAGDKVQYVFASNQKSATGADYTYYPEGDGLVYEVAEDGAYTVTFTYDPAAAALTVENTIAVEKYTPAELVLWSSETSVTADWGSDAIKIEANNDNLAGAKVGDIIHVAAEVANPGSAWSAQVVLKDGAWTDLESGIPVGDLAESDAQFVITGDMLKYIKATGLMASGAGYSTKLVTLEVTETTGSEESVWVGSSTSAVTVGPAHFKNANDKAGIKAGDIIRVTTSGAAEWIIAQYSGSDTNWDWKDYENMGATRTETGYDFVVNDAAIEHLKTDGIIINFPGDITITQVEVISATAPLYILGGMNGWDLTAMTEMTFNAETQAYEYTYGPTEKDYFVFSDKQFTAEEAAAENAWELFNENNRYALTVSGDQIATLNEALTLVKATGGGTIAVKPVKEGTTYKISVAKDLSTVTITGESAPEPDYTFIIAGTPAEIFGTEWDASNQANLMEKQNDGTYAKTYTVDKAYENVQLKVVKIVEGEDPQWIGDAYGQNVSFILSGAGSFTVTIDPETNEITVTGDNVMVPTGFDYSSVYAVGNGSDGWLNGESWTPNAEANKMTKVDGTDDVWEITFKDVPATPAGADWYQVKFAIDGSWDNNFGGEFSAFGEVTAAVYDGGNIAFELTEACDVTLRLDLTDFDITTKQGATFAIIAPALDKSALEAEIATATTLLGDASTEEGPGKDLADAIAAAQDALKNATTQAEIDAALGDLKTAEEAFEAATGIHMVNAAKYGEGKWYTMQGVEIPQPTKKGLYIHNGKTVVVK